MQEIIVYIIISIAVFFTAKYIYKRIGGKKNKDECGNCKCGCGCCSCNK